MCGGSEYRFITMANAVAKYTPHESFLLCEGNIPDRLKEDVDKRVHLVTNVVKDEAKNSRYLYEMDVITIINSDSYNFAKIEYWEGKTEKHQNYIDVSKIKRMIFLMNFIVGPAQHLPSLEGKGPEIRIICTNKRFFDEFTYKDKLIPARHYPRIILNSPVDPDTVSTAKTYSDKIRIGKHSKGFGNKFNEEHSLLINTINNKYKDKIMWDFMGVPKESENILKNIDNVILRKEFSLSVKDYLMGIDVFLFFPSWKRVEPWARVVAEGMASGCPIIATNKGGNIEQVLHQNNGFLCENIDDFVKYVSYFIENPKRIKEMGRNSVIYSRDFTSKNIIEKFIDFIS
jgi:glycosyltransferase involved in cell wall biosynthesis